MRREEAVEIVMKPGDLVLYKNTHRIPLPLLGMILKEERNIAVDTRFFTVRLCDGRTLLIPDHYLTPVQNGDEG